MVAVNPKKTTRVQIDPTRHARDYDKEERIRKIEEESNQHDIKKKNIWTSQTS